MDKEKIIKIVNTAENATNNDLFTASKELEAEFSKTKGLILELTNHLDVVTKMFKTIDGEIKKRRKPL